MAGPTSGFLRDPIYGLVALQPVESEILGLPLLTRLKGIRQMGFAWSVFPGANHTRFEHSVGVMHVAGLLVSELPGFDARTVQLLRLAGLLHDVGHPPFSHTLELAARLYGKEEKHPELMGLASHERVTERRISQDPALAQVLKRHPSTRSITPKEIAQLAVGRHPDPALNPLIHGEIDADRVDYIVRDNLHCGFPSGIDTHILPSLFFRRDDGRIVLNADRAYFAEQLLLARHHLQVRIHDEPRNRLADLLLARAVQAFLAHGDPGRRRRFKAVAETGGDAELLELLKSGAREPVRELEKHLAGPSPWRLLAEVGFTELSPPGRYSLSLLLEPDHRDLSVALGRRLAPWLKVPVLVDAWGATPPSDSLLCATPGSPTSPVPLTSLPLIRGTVEATHRAMGVRIYVPHTGPAPAVGLEGAQERYQNAVDPIFDIERARRVAQRLYRGEETGYAVGLEVEAALALTLREARQTSAFPPDAILLLLQALFDAFASAPLHERRVYLDGVRGFPLLAAAANLPSSWVRILHEPYPYARPPANAEGASEADLGEALDRLEAFGLLQRLSRVERHARAFAPTERFALSGWGRGAVRESLLTIPRWARLYDEVRGTLTAYVARNKAEFAAFFELAGRPDPGARRDRARARGELPLPVSR